MGISNFKASLLAHLLSDTCQKFDFFGSFGVIFGDAKSRHPDEQMLTVIWRIFIVGFCDTTCRQIGDSAFSKCR